MFEDSFVEARVRAADGNRRWLMTGSLLWQAALAAALVVLPMLQPQSIAARAWGVRTAPVFRKPAVPKVEAMRLTTAARGAASGPPAPVTMERPAARRAVEGPDRMPDLALTSLSEGLGTGEALGRITDGVGSGSRSVTVAPAASVAGPRAAMRVSSGVAAGLLTTPIRPVYPVLAAHAGVQGVVVVDATISKTGAIVSARVVSGPALLREAALSAIEAAHYQPYRLNGEPVEVQTTISIHFNLGGGA